MFLFVLFCKVWRLPQVKFIKTPEVLGPALGQPTTSTSQLHPSCLRTLPNISRNITKQISPPSLSLTYISLSKLSHNNITSVSDGHDTLVQAPTITWKKQSLFLPHDQTVPQYDMGSGLRVSKRFLWCIFSGQPKIDSDFIKTFLNKEKSSKSEIHSITDSASKAATLIDKFFCKLIEFSFRWFLWP